MVKRRDVETFSRRATDGKSCTGVKSGCQEGMSPRLISFQRRAVLRFNGETFSGERRDVETELDRWKRLQQRRDVETFSPEKAPGKRFHDALRVCGPVRVDYVSATWKRFPAKSAARKTFPRRAVSQKTARRGNAAAACPTGAVRF